MDKQERIKARDAVLKAEGFDEEQEALKKAMIVDILPSLPIGKAADLYHQWDIKQYPEATKDYVKICKQIGAGYDRGARRYVIAPKDAERARKALHDEGFVVAVHHSLKG